MNKVADLLVTEREKAHEPLEYLPHQTMGQEWGWSNDLISYVELVGDPVRFKAAANAALEAAARKNDPAAEKDDGKGQDGNTDEK